MAQNITLQDGEAHYMGEGVFALLQRDEHGKAQNVVVTVQDLQALLEAAGA